MFCVCLVPLTPLLPQGLNFAHRGFAVRGGVQEGSPRERRGCTVIEYTQQEFIYIRFS
jgi:hypothetical protein